MDYTPISARRVVVAFTSTMVVALLPALWLVLGASNSGSLTSLVGSAHDGAAPTIVAAGVVIAVVMVTAMVVLVVGRRMVRRPTSA